MFKDYVQYISNIMPKSEATFIFMNYSIYKVVDNQLFM